MTLSNGNHSKNKNPVLGNAIPVFSVKPKRVWCVFWLFFKIGLRSAISFKRSRGELSIDVAEHRYMLKNSQNTHYPRFSFIPKTCIHSIPQNGWFVLSVMSCHMTRQRLRQRLFPREVKTFHYTLIETVRKGRYLHM